MAERLAVGKRAIRSDVKKTRKQRQSHEKSVLDHIAGHTNISSNSTTFIVAIIKNKHFLFLHVFRAIPYLINVILEGGREISWALPRSDVHRMNDLLIF